MLKQLTYKKRNLLLISGMVLFSIVIYISPIKKTIDLHTQCNELEEKLLLANNSSSQLSLLQKQLHEVEDIFGDKGETYNNYQQNLLEIISNYCSLNNVILREFPTPIILNEQEFSVETNVVVVDGSFSNILNLIYLLEQKKKTGKISSLQFNSKKNFKTKQLGLSASLYIQNVKKI
ncbi:MAG: hypothetical protein M3Q58_09225 [Bacteroidota bacterium]|nr:hypothetical protein [Bacteroidota bacterium]